MGDSGTFLIANTASSNTLNLKGCRVVKKLKTTWSSRIGVISLEDGG